MRRLRQILTTGSLLALPLLAAAAQAEDLGKPTEGAIGFQTPVTPVGEMVVDFHNYWLMPLITIIVLLVMGLMAWIMWRYSEKRNPVPSKTSHNTLIEIIWTVVPVLALMIIVVPSMKLLYFQDVIPESDMTIKVTGDTWAWNYDYPDFADNVEGYISNVLEEDAAAAMGKPYLLGTDAPLVVPVDTVVKVLVTSNNNMHAFAMPAFGIKMDAVPGIVNETWFEVKKEGTFYGQCSEICGIKHAFMPIEIEVVSKDAFARWVAAGGPINETTGRAELNAPAIATNNSESATTTALPK